MAPTEGFDSWRDATKSIPDMNEQELLHAMNYEVAKYNRTSIVLRMHQRYTKLRAQREREQMAQGMVLL